jgi:hypothetical protein
MKVPLTAGSLATAGKSDAARCLATTGVSERAALSVPAFVWKYRTLMGGSRIAQQETGGLEE